MTIRFIIKIFFSLLLFGCQSNTRRNSDDKFSKPITNSSKEKNVTNDEDSYLDDTYCAELEYHNPNTGTKSSYILTVKVESNEIVEIHWPNGGKLDENHFSGANLDEEGHASFTNDKGYEYDVQIVGLSAGCFNNVPMVKQCKGITKNGKRCRHMTDNQNGLCWQHQNQE